jgi:hypothetical protein
MEGVAMKDAENEPTTITGWIASLLMISLAANVWHAMTPSACLLDHGYQVINQWSHCHFEGNVKSVVTFETRGSLSDCGIRQFWTRGTLKIYEGDRLLFESALKQQECGVNSLQVF